MAHTLAMSQTNRLTSFHLTTVDGIDAASDNLREVSSGVDGNDENCSQERTHIYIKEEFTSIIDKDGLDHHRGSAEDFDVDGQDDLNYFEEEVSYGTATLFVGRYGADDLNK